MSPIAQETKKENRDLILWVTCCGVTEADFHGSYFVRHAWTPTTSGEGTSCDATATKMCKNSKRATETPSSKGES